MSVAPAGFSGAGGRRRSSASPSTAASTSSLPIRPDGPLPWTFVRSIPWAAATRRATGRGVRVVVGDRGAVAGRVPGRARGARRLGCRIRCTGCAPAPAADPAEHLADLDGGARLDEQLGHRAARGRGDLGVDLVGRDLDDRLVGLDRVADRLGPLEHGPLGDRLAHRRHDDVDRLGGRLVLGRGGLVAAGVLAAARRRARRRWSARSPPSTLRRRRSCRPRRRGSSRRSR